MSKTLEGLFKDIYEQFDHVKDRKLKGEALKEEINRAESMTRQASTMLAVGNLALRAKLAADGAIGEIDMPFLLGDKTGKTKNAGAASTGRPPLIRRPPDE